MLQDILAHPAIRQGMQNPRVTEAFQQMIANPDSAHEYLTDPVVCQLDSCFHSKH